MTEAEWLASDTSEPMTNRLLAGSLRKQRLLCLVCCERFRDLLQHKDATHALATAERWIEGKCQEGQRKAARRGATYAANAASEASIEAGLTLSDSAVWSVQRLLHAGHLEVSNILYALADARLKHAGARAYLSKTSTDIADRERTSAWRNERAAQANLIREVFGNPFRPIIFDPAWRTADVLLLARGIYEDKAFDRMPILADALQDAGCDNDDVLNHCRDANQVHVRGCWVVDLVLGKE